MVPELVNGLMMLRCDRVGESIKEEGVDCGQEGVECGQDGVECGQDGMKCGQEGVKCGQQEGIKDSIVLHCSDHTGKF